MKTKLTSLLLIIVGIGLIQDKHEANLKVAREMYGELAVRVSLLESNSEGVETEFEKPNATPVYAKLVNENYSIKNKSVVLSHWLNQNLKGVLSGKGEHIIKAAKEKGICPVFLAAIAMHESANGTSKIAKEKRNVCGVMIAGKTFRVFKSVEESLSYTASLLSGKIYRNCKTVADIQKVYAPQYCKNDPKGLNAHWKTGVVKYMRQIAGNEIYSVRS